VFWRVNIELLRSSMIEDIEEIRHFPEFLVFKLWHLDKTVGLGNGSTEIEEPQEDEESR